MVELTQRLTKQTSSKKELISDPFILMNLLVVSFVLLNVFSVYYVFIDLVFTCQCAEAAKIQK